MQPTPLNYTELQFRTSDNWQLTGQLFQLSEMTSSLVIILPAMGVQAKHYQHMAAFLATAGHTVLTLDLRGQGKSKPRPSSKVNFGLDHFLKIDLPAVMQHMKLRCGSSPITLLGHSLGGYIASIYAAENPQKVRSVVTLTSAHLHFKYLYYVSILIFGGFIGLAKLLRYVPGQYLGLGGPIARQLVLDWSKWALTGKFRSSDGRRLENSLAQSTFNSLCIGFEDDWFFAPPKSTNAYSKLFHPDCNTYWCFKPIQLGAAQLGHFGHLKSTPVLWGHINKWIFEQN
jgi:predicted alpha/beta hydrolase